MCFINTYAIKKPTEKKLGSSNPKGKIADNVPIEMRPEIVEQKIRVGDFEIDLIIGKGIKELN